MNKFKTRFSVLIMMVALLAPLGFGQASEPANTDPLALNPATGCMEGMFAANQDDAERTVLASAILESLRGNPCLRLDHAIVRGDLDFHELPVSGIGPSGADVVGIAGAFVATNTVFEGALLAGKSQTAPQVAFYGPAVFSHSTFAGFDFTGAYFGMDAQFDNTTFSESAKLDQIEFSRNANFNRAVFEKPVFMNRVSVAGELDLSQSSFASLVRGFGLSADTFLLTGANFRTTTDFSSAMVNNVNAFQAVFEQNIDFKNGVWEGVVNFEQAKFLGNGDFSDVAFGGRHANFRSARFEKNAAFTRARFFGQADFTSADFMLNTILNSAEFYQQATFKRIESGLLLRMVGASFFQLANFSDAAFAAIEMTDAAFVNTAPIWRNVTISGEVQMEGATSPAPWHTDHPALMQVHDDEPAEPVEENVIDAIEYAEPEPASSMSLGLAEMMLIGILAGVAALLALQLMN